jgi:uncharacterized repeat protein (TIGR03803 family)
MLRIWRGIGTGICGFALLSLSALSTAAAKDYKVLYSFRGNVSGYMPIGLTADAAGNLYGVTKYECAQVFGIAAHGKERTLFPLCYTGYPAAGVTVDNSGNLYGTLASGGNNNSGIVYKLSPNDGTYTETVLYSFTGNDDGGNPESTLILDGAGNLYGTTSAGGNGYGVVFEVGQDGSEDVLYAFQGGQDGAMPTGSLVVDEAGNLYGTTGEDGAAGNGTAFELTPNGGSYTETVLYSFCSHANCVDGAAPNGGLAIFNGTLYGTTSAGGTHAAGTLFEVDPDTRTESVLYSFCAQPNCADGSSPFAAPIVDGAGNLYGTTAYGGLCAYCGTVFKLTADGSRTVLHEFCSNAAKDCSDGYQPMSNMVLYKGNLYGTTSYGGHVGKQCEGSCGVVFELRK